MAIRVIDILEMIHLHYDAGERISGSDSRRYFRGHCENRLGVNAGKKQMRSPLAAFVVEFIQRVHARGVDGGDAAHSKNKHLRRALQAAQGVFETVRYAEEEWTVDFVNFHAAGNITANH